MQIKINISVNTDLTKNYKLDQKHFEKFKKFFDVWLAEFGLKGWEVAYFFRETKDGDGDDARASVHIDSSGRIVVCCLNKEWYGSEPTDHNLARCAYHEVLEVMLIKINELARQKCTDLEITEEIHRIIRIFENVHFEQVWKKYGKTKSSPS